MRAISERDETTINQLLGIAARVGGASGLVREACIHASRTHSPLSEFDEAVLYMINTKYPKIAAEKREEYLLDRLYQQMDEREREWAVADVLLWRADRSYAESLGVRLQQEHRAVIRNHPGSH